MLTKTLPKTLLTKTQSPGFFFSSLLMAFITIWPINRSEAQMRISAFTRIDVIKTGMTQTTGQMPNKEIYPGKNTRPVERPGPPKPKKPVIAHRPVERFQII